MKIEELIPFLKNGWVAMDGRGRWSWYGGVKMERLDNTKDWRLDDEVCWLSDAFDIEPVENWQESLIEIKDGKRV